jgi:DNA transformation protein
MGTKGAKDSTVGRAAAEALVDDLQSLGAVTSKRMFGGHGIFHDGTMFAIVDSTGGCFLRSDAATTRCFEERGSAKHDRMPYWQIPDAVRDHEATLLSWAQQSVEIAHAAK